VHAQAVSPYEAARTPAVHLGGKLVDAADPSTWPGDDPPAAECLVCHTGTKLMRFGARPRDVLLCRTHAEAALRRLGQPRRGPQHECPRHSSNVPAVAVWPLRTVLDASEPTISACIDCLRQSADDLAAQAADHQETLS
jgi:hypothetical protein